jgi:nitrous oxide reductase
VEMVEGIPAPEGSSLSVDFKQDFKIFLSVNGESMEKGSWKLSKDGKKIELTDYSGKVEVWGIKVLDKKALVFMDYISGEIVLKKAKK